MVAHARIVDPSLLGVGIYTPADAGLLTGISAARIRRWLRGHEANGRHYAELWMPQIDIDDDRTYLGFRDLTEVRVVAALIREGLSAQKVRRAIELARDRYGLERPLSTSRFRTDGKQIFLRLADEGPDRMVDLFRDQYVIRQVIEPSFKGLQFDREGEPVRWQIAQEVLIDPDFAFGQPVDEETFVPTRVLAAAVAVEGSAAAAARSYGVSARAVAHAVAFERTLQRRKAA